MRLIIIGGHLTPALAIIDALPKNTEVFYVGRKYTFEGDSGLSLEYLTITKRKIPFINLTTGRIQRSFSFLTIQSFAKIPYGTLQAIKILKEIKPDIVVGFGGYISVPVGFAAFLFHIPFVMHEQTQDVGLANFLLGKIAQKICISFPSSAKHFPKEKTVLTGNPILLERPSNDIQTIIPSGKFPLLCITGGSAGSHEINVFIEKHLKTLLRHYRILHQTGDAQVFRDYDRLYKIREQLLPVEKSRYSLIKFITPENIQTIFEKSDLVISRSGINTMTLLMLLQKQSILIPLLTGQKNEQKKNAQYLKHNDLASIITDLTISDETLLTMIEERILKKDISDRIQKNMLLHKQAASRIIHIVYDSVTREAKT